jgi:hypothetical protein
MILQYFHDEPEAAFRSVISELRTMNPKIRTNIFENLSIVQIDNMLDDLLLREKKIIRESHPYGSWLMNPLYMQIKMLQEGLTKLREYREELEESEVIVPGFTYYRHVKQFGKRVEGQICKYLGESRPANWINFLDISPVMKVMEVLRHGDANDFRKLYVEIANGRPDGLYNITTEHITESTDQALLKMEQYCDTCWEGPWPWEVSPPFKVTKLIEEKTKMRNKTINEMHYLFQKLLEMNEEGGAEKFEIISYSRSLSEEIQSLIDKFAKIAGETIISFKSQVLTVMGDEAAMKVEHSITAPINQAADALSRLKANVDRLIIELEQHQDSGLEQTGGMDDGTMSGGDGMGGMPNDPNDMMGGPDQGPGAAGGAGGPPPPGGDMNAGPNMPPGGSSNIMPERAKKIK